jgi:hypothetical protein
VQNGFGLYLHRFIVTDELSRHPSSGDEAWLKPLTADHRSELEPVGATAVWALQGPQRRGRAVYKT